MTDIPVSPIDIANANGTSPPADPQPPTMLDSYRANHPDAPTSDYVLSRQIYDSGLHKENESYPAFASRVGVTQQPLETALSKGLTTAGLGLANPIESGFSGLGSLLSGGSFGQGYKEKRQELADQDAVGSFQNPVSNAGGDVAGTVADYTKLGPVFRGVADRVPGLAQIAKSGPLGDSIAKFFGLAEANEIPKMLEREAVDDKWHVGQDALDLGKAGAEGAASAALGSGVAKGLNTVVGPLTRGFGSGLIAADDAASGMPRTIYTKAAQKMGAGFTGDTNPAAASLTRDTAFYNDLLDHSALNVSKGVDQLGDLMERPGYTGRILDAAKKALPDDSGATIGDTNPQATDPSFFSSSHSGVFDSAIDAMNNGDEGGAAAAKQALNTTITRLQAQDPTGESARQFMADIYKDIIPQRLQAPFDPSSDFDRNAISGKLNDSGKLIPPPVTGMGKLAQQLWERSGGGAGRVMWPMLATEPKATIAGFGSVIQQGGTIPMKVAGYGLDAAGKVASGLGEPGVTAGDFIDRLLPNSLASSDGAASLLKNMPGAYQTGLYQASTAAPSTNTPMFPDTYKPPIGQQHTELPTGANVQNWLASTDRGSATNLVAQRLGPDVAKQLASTDDLGFKAALFGLASDPNYRKQLAASPLPAENEGGAGDIPSMTVRPGDAG